LNFQWVVVRKKRAFGLRLGSWKAATGQQVFVFYLPKLTTLDGFFENLKKNMYRYLLFFLSPEFCKGKQEKSGWMRVSSLATGRQYWNQAKC